MIYGHGDDAYRYGSSIRLDFSSNIYNHADLAGLKEHLATRMDLIAHYPEPEPHGVEQLLASQLGISSDCLLLTNGCTEAIYLLAQLFRGRPSVIPQPTFSEYADACRLYGHVISYEKNDELSHLPEDRIYWICNPNNPTGNVLMKGFTDYVVRRNREYTFIVDQSYEHYTQEALFTAAETVEHPNLIVLHSLTKQFAVPGLRLGYITANAATISRLRALRQPWAFNALSLEAARYLLSSTPSSCIPDLTAYLDEARRLHDGLNRLPGLRVMDTKSSFMMVQIEPRTSTELKQYLAEKHGILIRDCANFYSLSNHYFRVSTQQKEENDELLKAIETFLNEETNNTKK